MRFVKNVVVFDTLGIILRVAASIAKIVAYAVVCGLIAGVTWTMPMPTIRGDFYGGLAFVLCLVLANATLVGTAIFLGKKLRGRFQRPGFFARVLVENYLPLGLLLVVWPASMVLAGLLAPAHIAITHAETAFAFALAFAFSAATFASTSSSKRAEA